MTPSNLLVLNHQGTKSNKEPIVFESQSNGMYISIIAFISIICYYVDIG
jgi:hypothetical protein